MYITIFWKIKGVIDNNMNIHSQMCKIILLSLRKLCSVFFSSTMPLNTKDLPSFTSLLVS